MQNIRSLKAETKFENVICFQIFLLPFNGVIKEFVGIDSLHTSQQFFSHVGTFGLNQY